MFCDKVRIRFRKAGDLRLVSHHDLMRCFERMLRRSALPFHSTSGFNPHPRLVFALSLPLGVIGCEEVVELELDAEVPPEEVHQRLAQQAPAGLEILSVRRIDRKARAQVCGAHYRVPLPAARVSETTERAAAALTAAECWVERTRPERRRLNIRPYLRDLRVGDGVLEMELIVTPTGTARPDDVLNLLELGDLLDAGTVVERLRLDLHDENIPPEMSAIPSKGETASPLPAGAPGRVNDEGRGTP